MPRQLHLLNRIVAISFCHAGAALWVLISAASARDLRPVARIGDSIPIPPLASTVTVAPAVNFLSSGALTVPLVSPRGDSVLSATVRGLNPLAPQQTSFAYWIQRANGSREWLFVNGMLAPDDPSTAYDNIPANSTVRSPLILGFSPLGRVALVSDLISAGSSIGNAYWCKVGESLKLIARVGQTVTGPDGRSYTINSLIQSTSAMRIPFDTSDGCGMAFQASVNDGGTVRNSAIIRASTSGAEILLPGAGASLFGHPDLSLIGLSFIRSNSNGDVMAGITLMENGQTTVNDRAILFAGRGTNLDILAREGSPAPGYSPGPIKTLDWGDSFGTPTLSANGKVAFLASFDQPDPLPDLRAYWSNRSNSGDIVLRAGDPILNQPGTTFTGATRYDLLDDDSMMLWGSLGGTSGNSNGALLVLRPNCGDITAHCINSVFRDGYQIPGQADGFKIAPDAFQADSFGNILSAAFTTTVVHGQSEFAVSTTGGLTAPYHRIMLRSTDPEDPLVLENGRVFSPEGDTMISIPISANFSLDETGGLALTASVQRAGSQSVDVLSLVTVNPRGQADLAFAVGDRNGNQVLDDGDTICLDRDNGGVCPQLLRSVSVFPAGSVDTTGDLQSDSGRAFANLDFGMSGQAIVYARTGCRADINENGIVSVQDTFDYLERFQHGLGDVNGLGNTSVQDIFDFLRAYFSGC